MEKRSGFFVPLKRSFPLKRSLPVLNFYAVVLWTSKDLSAGWMRHFKSRHGLHYKKAHETDEEEFGELNKLDIGFS